MRLVSKFYLNKWDLNQFRYALAVQDGMVLSEQVGFKPGSFSLSVQQTGKFYLNKWDLNTTGSFSSKLKATQVLSEQVGFKPRRAVAAALARPAFYLNKWDLNRQEFRRNAVSV